MTTTAPTTPETTTFAWHPEYKGRDADQVMRELAEQVRRDQQGHALALENAEREEHAAFKSIMDYEKRWGDYDFGWSEADPDELARKIVNFELERDRRQEMISWREYRDMESPASSPTDRASGDWRERMTDDQRRKTANGLAAVVVLILAILMIAALWMLL